MPIPEIIEQIKREGGMVLNEKTTVIDQFAGLKKASDPGLRRVAASVAGFQSKAISEMRSLGSDG